MTEQDEGQQARANDETPTKDGLAVDIGASDSAEPDSGGGNPVTDSVGQQVGETWRVTDAAGGGWLVVNTSKVEAGVVYTRHEADHLSAVLNAYESLYADLTRKLAEANKIGVQFAAQNEDSVKKADAERTRADGLAAALREIAHDPEVHGLLKMPLGWCPGCRAHDALTTEEAGT